MKKSLYILSALFIGVGLYSCKNQDDVYQEFVKKGGYVYPQKTNGLGIFSGYKRIKLVWDVPKDPSVRTAKVFWNNKTDVKDIDYASHTGDRVELLVDGLEERSYTFQLVNFDAKGNQSMTAEITAATYAENWLMVHADRTVSSAQVNGNAADLVMSYGTDEMIATRFRYVNTVGETVVNDQTMNAASNKISLPDAISGKRFEFSSSYCPTGGLDTIWNDWKKSINPISGNCIHLSHLMQFHCMITVMIQVYLKGSMFCTALRVSLKKPSGTLKLAVQLKNPLRVWMDIS